MSDPVTCLVCETEVTLRVVPKLRSSERAKDLLIALRVLADANATCSNEMCEVCAPLVVHCDELFCSLRETVRSLESRRPSLGQIHQLEVSEDFCHIIADALGGSTFRQAWPSDDEETATNAANVELGSVSGLSNVFELDSISDAPSSPVSNVDYPAVIVSDGCEFQLPSIFSVKSVVDPSQPENPPQGMLVGRDFQTSTHAQVVEEIQQKIKKVPCPSCHENFGSKRALLAHECCVHGKTPNYRCDICGKGFETKDSIRFHKRIHYPDSRLCHLCGKNVPLGSFASHVAAHQRQKPQHECIQCGAAFSRSGALGLHMKSAHGVADSLLIPGTEEKRCPNCSWSGKNKDYFLSHMFLTHGVRLPGLVELPCPVCDRIFYGNKIFKKHVGTHAGKK